MVVHTIRVINPTIHVRIQYDRYAEMRQYKLDDLPPDVRNVYELASWMAAHFQPLPRPLAIRVNGVDPDTEDGDPYFRHNDMIDFFHDPT